MKEGTRMPDETRQALEDIKSIVKEQKETFFLHMKDDKEAFGKISETLSEIKVNLAEIVGSIKIMNVTVTSVHEQAAKTNGRVTSLEKEHDSMKNTVNRWKGGITVALILFGAFWSFITFIYPYIHKNNEVIVTVEKPYEIEN